MMSVPLSRVLIPTKTQQSIDARVWSWIKRRPTDAILVVGWVLFAIYLAIYLGSGAWRIAT
jgi:hypothetical protein